MDYEQIIRDVKQFQTVVRSYGIVGYAPIGSLVLEYCLSDHDIKAEIVKGYIVIQDTYQVLHLWNKVHLDGKELQIDMSYSVAKEMGFTTKYVLVSKDKWKFSIDTKEEQAMYDNTLEFYTQYRDKGGEIAVKCLGKFRNKLVDMVWMDIFDRVSKLKTFKSINKYRGIFFG